MILVCFHRRQNLLDPHPSAVEHSMLKEGLILNGPDGCIEIKKLEKLSTDLKLMKKREKKSIVFLK